MRLESEGIALVYDETGEPGQPPLLLLHGLGDARSTWGAFVPGLSGRNRVVALDFRGHGESAHAPGTYTLDHYLADALTLGDTVLDQPAVVVGHSLGGVAALSMAQRRPELVRGLLLEDPPLYPTEDSPVVPFFSLIRQFTQEMQARHAPIEEYEAAMAAVPGRQGRRSMAELLGPEATRARAEAMARIDPDVFLPALDGTGLRGARPDLPVSCPVLVLRADPLLSAAFTSEHEKQFRATNPQAEVRVVLGAGHLVHEEEPERFSSELDSFLSQL